MVGVPGRSKACQTCKKRHISCDLQHLTQPACGQCTKSRRVCSFPKAHIFVNHDEGTHKTVYRKTDSEQDNVDPSLVCELNISEFQNGHNRTGESRLHESFPEPLPRTIPATALVRYQFLANARATLNFSRDSDAQFPTFWSSAITSASPSDCTSKSSPALACYTSWMGRQSDEPCLVEASRRLYVQGLQEVQQSVNDPSTALSDETLSACIGLVIYEALECPDRSYGAYHKHIDGCSALIKLRGVEAHRDGVGHDLFRGFRYIAVIKALQDHRGTYLVSPAWSEIPFSLHPKDIHDKLLDVLATGAGFLSQSDRLSTTPPGQILIALLDIDDKLLDLDARLDAIYDELMEQHEGRPVYWSAEPALSLVDETTDQSRGSSGGLHSPIHFPSPETARLLTLYWAQQTLLRMGRAEVRLALSNMAAAGLVSGHAEHVQRSLSQPIKSLLESAHLVLRSREYCCSSQSTVLRYSVPLNITLDVLANKPELYVEEIKVAKEVKREISGRFLRITRYTSTLQHVKEV